MRSIHALLVGIDRYAGGVADLAGCVNDIRAVEELLPGILDDTVALRPPLVLLNEQATRDAVIAGFRDHLTAAGPGDVALFWYSGHGAQQATAPEFAAAEPDGLDETLVCHDSRAGAWDLADKELAALVAQVSATGAHVLLVLDCCHSGSGVRATEEGGTAVRRATIDRRARPADSYLARSPGTTGAAGWDLGDQATYVLLAACRSDQTAKETTIDGQRRGAFSAALQAAIANTGGRLSYADLVAWAGTRIANIVRAQDPQLECTDSADARRGFLAETVAPASTAYRMLHDGAGWFLNAGAVHGIPAPRGEETVLLSARPATEPAAPGVAARVTAVEAHRSRVEPAEPLDPAVVYRAAVTAWPLARLTVELIGPDEPLAPVRTALTESRLAAERDAEPDVTVEATAGGYRIGSPRGGLRLAHTIDGHGPDAVAEVAEKVERIARWRMVRELTNPASSLSPDGLQIEIETDPPTDTSGSGPVPLVYGTDAHGDERPPSIKVQVRNRTQRTLFVAILFLNEEHGVFNTLGAAGCEMVRPGDPLSAAGGNWLSVEIPDHLHADGVTTITDWVKVIACTEQFDVGELVQTELTAAVVRHAPADNVLDQLLSRATRMIKVRPADVAADWQTATRVITVERPGAGVPLEPDAAADLGAGLTLQTPVGFVGRARLVSVETTTRDLGRPVVPPLLRDPAFSQPLTLVPSRDESDVSVLEIDVAAGGAEVDPDHPLVLTLPVELAADEHVLAVAQDGEYWLPVGRVRKRAPGATSIVIERLPAAQQSTRGLWNSVRIMFRKLAGRAIGLRYEHPVLAAATVAAAPNGAPTVHYDRDDIADRVAGARAVLLLVHGIIGDTRGLVEFAARAGDRYDLVLTFDYESIHTTVEENARELLHRLTDLGFGPDRRLDVVAHSMGGLVVRWMIEKEDGRLVRRAVLAGTPHAGSPWPTIQGWATTALGLALNGLSTVIWPAGVLGALVQAIERVDNAVDDMSAGSPMLAQLGAAADPAVPYTLVVGDNTVPDGGRVTGLLHRLGVRKLLDPAAALAFLGQPNDLAVSAVSAGAVPGPRHPDPVTVRVSCDHLTYFLSAAGGAAVEAALRQ